MLRVQWWVIERVDLGIHLHDDENEVNAEEHPNGEEQRTLVEVGDGLYRMDGRTPDTVSVSVLSSGFSFFFQGVQLVSTRAIATLNQKKTF